MAWRVRDMPPSFPQAIGMAATWDTDLIHHEAEIISTEARAKYGDAIAHDNHGIYYGLDFWSPNINIFRDPRWGRGQETYGEDPYLTGRLGVAFVESMQGDNPKYYKVIATPKHYAVHSGPESTRHTANVDVSPYDLWDTYLPAFRATITEAHADSIMCAYNSIDGQPACANTMLLKDILRGDWKFHGLCHLRLRSHRRHLRRPQVCARPDGGLGARGEGGNRHHLRSGPSGISDARPGGERRKDRRGRDRYRSDAALHRAIQAGHVRSGRTACLTRRFRSPKTTLPSTGRPRSRPRRNRSSC